MVKNKMLSKICKVTSVLLIFLLMTIPVFAQPTQMHDANAMWVDPPSVDMQGQSVGTKFNVTIWINLDSECASWEFKLIYNNDYFNI